MAHLQRMVGSQQATRHSGQVHRHLESGDRGRQRIGLRREHHGLAADHHQRPLGLGERGLRRAQGAFPGLGRLHGQHPLGGGQVAAVEHLAHVPVQVEAQHPVGGAGALARRLGVPLADRRLVVQQVHRAFHEHRAGHAGAGDGEGLLDGRAQVAHLHDLAEQLDVRLHQRPLVDVLQRAAALQRGGRRPTEQDHRRLRQLRVLQRGDGVGDAGAGGDGGHAGNARKPRRGVGREHGGCFVAHVDDADAAGLGRAEDRRDVAAAQGEEAAHAVHAQRFGHAVAAMAQGKGRFHRIFLFRPSGPWCRWNTSCPRRRRPRIRCGCAGSSWSG